MYRVCRLVRSESRNEPETRAVARDTSDVRSEEMSRDEQRVRLRRTFKEAATTLSGQQRNLAIRAVQIRVSNLNGIVDDVAQEDARLAAVAGPYRHVPGRVSRCRNDGQDLVDFVRTGDDQRL